jgi:hypothetical protein
MLVPMVLRSKGSVDQRHEQKVHVTGLLPSVLRRPASVQPEGATQSAKRHVLVSRLARREARRD